MGQRTTSLTRILGIAGWQVAEAHFEWASGPEEGGSLRVDLRVNPNPSPTTARLILRLARRYTARCPRCGALCCRSMRSSRTRTR
jgi:hypothetical protein